MTGSRVAQRLGVATLIGLMIGPSGPVHAAAVMSWGPGEPAQDAAAPAEGDGSAAAQDEPAGDDTPADDAAASDEPKDDAAGDEPSDDAVGDEPKDDAAGDDAANGDEPSDDAAAGDGPSGDAANGDEPSDDAAAGDGPSDDEGATGEVITVRPSTSATAPDGKTLAPAQSSEIVTDPRRTRSDERIMLRASFISFGVAGAAVVPMVIGLQQRAYTGRVLDELDTPSEQSMRADVEQQRSRMTTLAIAGGVVAGAQLVTGAVLLGVALRGRTPKRHAFAPAVGRGRLGLVWQARF